ncbi:RNA-binding motif protein, X-linked 2 [Anoplophora glabripennis]|uniref:RNA-binding motif protein, X-linked 2 n=1 Tax=Anoplophora glabripennis TaxID=217634 RepID=UPI0008753AB7|nr:RNA-binding motif protein, X-linked 2 [Anoplophora glabripennis]
MNPLTNMKNVIKLSEQELQTNNKTSWHDQYKNSAWVFVGGLPYDLSEGDIICIFSQYGEVVNINLIRSKDTGKSKGFCFLCYEDQRSTVLAVDNFNGIKVMNRTIRVDHVSDYKVPKEHKNTEEETKKLYVEGCAPQINVRRIPSPPTDFRETIADQIEADIKLPARLPIYPIREKSEEMVDIKKEKLEVKGKEQIKKEKKKRKQKKEYRSSSDDSSSEDKKKKKSKKRK